MRRIAAALILATVMLSPESAVACSDFARAPHTRWRVAADIPRLVTPCGDPFFSIGVDVVDAGTLAKSAREREQGYHWSKHHPSLTAWATVTIERLRQWGFNTAGAWSQPPNVLPLPAAVALHLNDGATRWDDPFAPDAVAALHKAAAEQAAPYRGSPYRIGYFSDNEIDWWPGAFLAVFSEKPSSNHTKRRLAEALRAYYADDWQAFRRDFIPPEEADSFAAWLAVEGVRTRLRPGSAGGMRFVQHWTGIFADHYYRTAREAIRAADPEGLFFGDRLAGRYEPEAVRAMARYVDAIAVNYNLDTEHGWVAPYFFSGLWRLSGGKPVLVTEWYLAADENRSGNRNRSTNPRFRPELNLTPFYAVVPTQQERARIAAIAARNFARQQGVAGLHWFMYADEPRGGRADGEDYNFGLVDVADRPYQPLVETFARINPELAALAGTSGRPGWAEILHLPEARIDTSDDALLDWPLEATRLEMRAAPDEVPFGDVHVAWTAEGAALAIIAMDYYDRHLIEAIAPPPAGEIFEILWDILPDGVDQPRRHAIRIAPEPAADTPSGFRLRAAACRREGADATARCEPAPGVMARHLTRVGQTRVVAEVRVPWTELGLAAGETAAAMRARIAVTSFHRARWMSSDGKAPGALSTDPAEWPLLRMGRAGWPADRATSP